MHPLPGTYALVLEATAKKNIQIGKLGTLDVERGFYVYIGSAFGPGGLKARIAHHQNNSSRPRWHIDYLKASLYLCEVWYTSDPVHREHQWANILGQSRGASVPLAGFGSSDCNCQSHLFFFRDLPSGRSFRRRLHLRFHEHAKIIIN